MTQGEFILAIVEITAILLSITAIIALSYGKKK